MPNDKPTHAENVERAPGISGKQHLANVMRADPEGRFAKIDQRAAESISKHFRGAGHNPPKPTHAESSRKGKRHVPRHMRGRGLISEKAMATMGAKLAEQAGHSEPGQSPTGKHGARAAKPPKGQRHSPAAKPRKGQLDSAYARSPVE